MPKTSRASHARATSNAAGGNYALDVDAAIVQEDKGRKMKKQKITQDSNTADTARITTRSRTRSGSITSGIGNIGVVNVLQSTDEPVPKSMESMTEGMQVDEPKSKRQGGRSIEEHEAIPVGGNLVLVPREKANARDSSLATTKRKSTKRIWNDTGTANVEENGEQQQQPQRIMVTSSTTSSPAQKKFPLPSYLKSESGRSSLDSLSNLSSQSFSEAEGSLSTAHPSSPRPLPSTQPGTHKRQCTYCGARQTPLWRTGPKGYRVLCNSCGVKWKRGKILTDVKEWQSGGRRGSISSLASTTEEPGLFSDSGADSSSTTVSMSKVASPKPKPTKKEKASKTKKSVLKGKGRGKEPTLTSAKPKSPTPTTRAGVKLSIGRPPTPATSSSASKERSRGSSRLMAPLEVDTSSGDLVTPTSSRARPKRKSEVDALQSWALSPEVPPQGRLRRRGSTSEQLLLVTSSPTATNEAEWKEPMNVDVDKVINEEEDVTMESPEIQVASPKRIVTSFARKPASLKPTSSLALSTATAAFTSTKPDKEPSFLPAPLPDKRQFPALYNRAIETLRTSLSPRSHTPSPSPPPLTNQEIHNLASMIPDLDAKTLLQVVGILKTDQVWETLDLERALREGRDVDVDIGLVGRDTWLRIGQILLPN